MSGFAAGAGAAPGAAGGGGVAGRLNKLDSRWPNVGAEPVGAGSGAGLGVGAAAGAGAAATAGAGAGAGAAARVVGAGAGAAGAGADATGAGAGAGVGAGAVATLLPSDEQPAAIRPSASRAAQLAPRSRRHAFWTRSIPLAVPRCPKSYISTLFGGRDEMAQTRKKRAPRLTIAAQEWQPQDGNRMVKPYG